MRLSVSEAAKRAGVSVRTLHYYDRITPKSEQTAKNSLFARLSEDFINCDDGHCYTDVAPDGHSR